MIIRDGYSQEAVEALAKYAGVPAFNGLTDEYHPTQMVADVMTMRKFSDRPIHDDSADDCDEHAVKIEKGHASMASKLKQPTANKRTNHPEDNVEEATCARAIYDFADDKTGDQPENNPAQD